MEELIRLYHGDGGKHTALLIRELFYKYFGNEMLLQGLDAGVFHTAEGRLAFTTDSFVIKPLFFPGGDIGKLAVYGTTNDLAVSGAKPLYVSAGFIIEEGFKLDELERIVRSMRVACQETGACIITGDTKVVEKGAVDGIFINTSGIGIVDCAYCHKEVKPGDHIIVTGSIAEHGAAIALERYKIPVKGPFSSDCGSVYNIITQLKPYYSGIKLMKDPTRGGLATALNEISEREGMESNICEHAIPIRREVEGICRLLGLDPLYLACEGRVILVVDPDISSAVLQRIKSCENGMGACIIGSFTGRREEVVYLQTNIGGKRILNPLEGPMLPRIC